MNVTQNIKVGIPEATAAKVILKIKSVRSALEDARAMLMNICEYT